MTAELLEILYKEKVTESVGSDAITDENRNIPTDQKVRSITFYFIYVLNQNQISLWSIEVSSVCMAAFLRWKVFGIPCSYSLTSLTTTLSCMIWSKNTFMPLSKQCVA